MSVNIGKMRHRVNVLAPVAEQDQYGQAIVNYTTLLQNVACSIEPVLGMSGKRFEAKQIYPEVTHRVKMRYRANIQTDMVVEFRGRRMSIRVVVNVMERGEKLELLCEERADGVQV
jgi:SPP1 family predicted phage head-tail adaptor